MARIDDVADRYEQYIAPMWQRNISGSQRVIFVVYPKEDERRLRARRNEFKLRTKNAGRRWREINITNVFAEWLAADEYREEYFKYPDDLKMKLDAEFLNYVAATLRESLTGTDTDEDTVTAFFGVAGLYGLIRLSDLLHEVETHIRGRLVVFFPGDRDGNNYRLLDARDG